MQRFNTLTASNTESISMDAIRAALPAVFAETAHPKMSDRYAFVSSANVLDGLVEAGYRIVMVQQRATRVRDPRFTRHMIRLRHRDAKFVAGEAVPELVLTNSHDGQSRYDLRGGLFRVVCSNGLVTPIIASVVSARHRGDAAAIIAAGDAVVKSVKQLGPRVSKMMKTKLTDRQMASFAAKAQKIAYDEPFNFDPKLLLTARRPEDDGADVWRTFNRIQENITRGGVEFQTPSGRTFATRGLTHIGRTIQFNSELWTAADALVA